jgi:para-aminobenzoate synthetase component 1
MPSTSNFIRRKHQARVIVQPVGLSQSPAAVLGLLAREEGLVMLDSSAMHEQWGRYTIITCRPTEVLTLEGGVLRDRMGMALCGDDASLWRELETAFRCVSSVGGDGWDGPLPGWFGYVGYEVGRHIERLPGKARRDGPLPDMRLAFHDAILAYDAVEGQWRLVELELDSPPAGAGRAALVLRRATEAAQITGAEENYQPVTVEQADAAPRPLAQCRSNFQPDGYHKAVARAIEYIAAGDIFQVNLSQRLTVEDAPAPLAIYRALRRRNPAWFAAYLAFRAGGQDCTILSASPELFLRLRDGRVVTRPIKGTRPRLGETAADASASADLLASPKDNAELAMIIDLLRNDLGKVCRPGTIRVREARSLETHPTVFHLVGTIEGHLRDGVGPAELLRATFPGGSITGAPKIRAMEIIDELEGLARGVYTGCVGRVGIDGSCDWNIAIRTILCQGRRATLSVGGGIVADSSPAAEYDETWAKARGLLEAVAEARNETSQTPARQAPTRGKELRRKAAQR